MLKPDYTPQQWQTMLFFWAILGFAVFINTVASKTLAYFEDLTLVLHILGFLGILIPLVCLSPHNDASFFTTFVNEGGWSSRGLSFMVGLSASVFTLMGESIFPPLNPLPLWLTSHEVPILLSM